MNNFLALFRHGAPSEATAEVVTAPRDISMGGATVAAVTPVHKERRNALGIKAVIDSSTTIRGPLETKNSALVDGTIEGNVTVTGTSRMALLRETCHVRGNVSAPIVMVAGEVHGDIVGRAVRLFRTAIVHGSITAERLGIDAGATIESGVVRCGEAASHAVREAMGERSVSAVADGPVAGGPSEFAAARRSQAA